METPVLVGGNTFFISSYRTYEEWKRYWTPGIWKEFCWFLPYLWGMETTPFHRKCQYLFTSSYRTYEEWKRHLSIFWWSSLRVLTVPMRNGNHLNRYRTRSSLRVLTVPMRNGNLLLHEKRVSLFPVLTVPMRNGNDTKLDGVNTKVEFLPYLWGMETRKVQIQYE